MNYNEYHDKFEEYILFVERNMHIFEVFRPGICSKFIFMYKEESIVDLFNKIIFHYDCRNIRQLYYYSQTGTLHRIDNYSNENITDFIINSQENNVPIQIVYRNPTVYRIFFEEE
jgi:hypothetical protein